MRIHTKKRHENKKLSREVIDIHPAEAGFLMNRLFKAVQEDVCSHCGKKGTYIRMTVDDLTKIRAFRICKECLVTR